MCSPRRNSGAGKGRRDEQLGLKKEFLKMKTEFLRIKVNLVEAVDIGRAELRSDAMNSAQCSSRKHSHPGAQRHTGGDYNGTA